jgi:RNA polymerase sigma-70 factor (ECF subfamily)
LGMEQGFSRGLTCKAVLYQARDSIKYLLEWKKHMADLNPQRWLDEHGDYLFRYARRRLMSAELAEDAVQETLLAALKARERFKGGSSERTWLTGILKHKVVDIIRQQTREVIAPGGESEDDPSDWETLFDQTGHWNQTFETWKNPETELEASRIRQALQDCLDSLKPNLARIFSLRELTGLSTEEICNELHVTATNVWVMLHRAKLFLRECLSQQI